MSNLLDETMEALKSHNKDIGDVIWVGSADGQYAISWFEFIMIAPITYNDSYGSQKIAKDLVIVGKDFWLERGEYDGSEWWEYKTIPSLELEPKTFSSVMNGDSWASIEEMNRPGGKYESSDL